MTPDFGSLVATHLIPALKKAYPDFQLILKLAFDFEDLQDPSFDLALRIGRVADEDLVVKPLGSFQRQLIASKKYLNANPIDNLDRLNEIDTLAFSNQQTSRIWTFYHQDDPKIKREISINAITAILVFRF